VGAGAGFAQALGVDEDGADEDGVDEDEEDEDGVDEEDAAGAASAGAAAAGGGDAAADGVNDGVRSRGVKREAVFVPESSPVVAGVDVAGDEASFCLAIPSAGSGGAVMAEPPAFAAPTPASASPSAVFSSVEFPLALVTGFVPVRAALLVPVDPERELPDLVRDDDMELLSTTASVSATSVTSVSSSVI
jgi:hypothetical protein